MHQAPGDRLSSASRALIFAYACSSSQGSEPGAGAALVRAAAAICDEVTVITRRGDSEPSRLAIELGRNVTVKEVGPPAGTLPTYANYLLWILHAAAEARQIRNVDGYTVVHHATYASDWFLNPLAFLRKGRRERWVWGPAGGATYPRRDVTVQVLGKVSTAERLRNILTRTSRRIVHRLLRNRVDVVIALNEDSARGFEGVKPGCILRATNAALDYAGFPKIGKVEPRSILFAGRGVAWKGLRPLIRSLEYLPDWALHIAGRGTAVPSYRELAKPYNERVIFHGPLDRDGTLRLMAGTAVFALPSLHDSAPWAAAEAAGLGKPVVCLPYGGVSSMAGPNAVVVDPTGYLPAAIAKAIAHAGTLSLEPFRGHTPDAMQRILLKAYGSSGGV